MKRNPVVKYFDQMYSVEEFVPVKLKNQLNHLTHRKELFNGSEIFFTMKALLLGQV
jgi:hypothetical protein